ncbi:hypothetical protein BOW53_11140 [Solemya pervernicosa gill symbiont]|uniref:Hydrazine synthase alpha subunit middle domain-containing protein n=1 Tax=Solemya pervernicosa gill symbiont TaxID=642797 RepID=A0A1T2L3G9_9GAMM|nr:hypothetical protein BOW53_11140 [Solemya pervernicosa gill symbiont]
MAPATEQSPDPVVQDFAIAYVKRPITESEDLRQRLGFIEGGDLYLRDLASPSAAESNITLIETEGLGDVRDVESSFDGDRLLFSLRKPDIEGADPEDQPTWNIWEYEIDSGILQRIIADDLTAEGGQDLAPHYLPDGRIIFSSTRQQQAKAVLVDEGKPQFTAEDEDRREYAAMLHVMNSDGSDIHQVSFNPSHDLDPTLLSSGKVLFSRWDNMGGRNAISLYTMRPDGGQLQLHYGAHSHNTGTDDTTVQFMRPREMPDGRLLSLIRPFNDTEDGGALIVIDTLNYIDNSGPTAANMGVLSGPAQTPATINSVSTLSGPSPGGRFRSAYPLDDGTERLLVSWSPCRLLEGTTIGPCSEAALADPDVVTAPPLYGLFIYDMSDDTQQPVVLPVEGVIFDEVVVAQPRDLPQVLYDDEGIDALLADEGVGLLDIRSVYDIDGVDSATPDITTLADPAQSTAAERPARFLRVIKAVSMPDDDLVDLDGSDFGRSSAQLMREIVAYAPIEPDGSIRIKLPANIPLAISLLDAEGKRIGARHQNWLQLRPGETLSCNGCHDHSSGAAHGHPEAAASINPGAVTTGLPFPNSVNTLWADFGETMAQARARISCQSDCAALSPSVDILYDDLWTDEAAAGRPRDASFVFQYIDLTTPAPVSNACQTSWSANCRIVINYEAHIQPLWDLDRGVNSCTLCHNTRDALDQLQTPDAQLDLSATASDQEPDHLTAYRELLFNDNRQEIDLDTGLLQDIQVQATDGSGNPLFLTDGSGALILDIDDNPIPIMVNITENPVMSVNGAAASPRFFAPFATGASHEGFLTPAELKLIAEWLDIGAQYYNNPFDVPVD